MRPIVLSVVAAVAMLSVSSLVASAMPADGSAIARIGQQIDPVISVKTKKKPKATPAASKAPCPADQERSNRTGQCRPARSQN
jgi:hypothetical protein